jgi:hypothetical protein
MYLSINSLCILALYLGTLINTFPWFTPEIDYLFLLKLSRCLFISFTGISSHAYIEYTTLSKSFFEHLLQGNE